MNKSLENTYQLKISFNEDVKDSVINFLFENEVHSFVEGEIDQLDLDPSHDKGLEEYNLLGGDKSPLSIYSFDESFLLALFGRLSSLFAKQIALVLTCQETSTWQEGWKSNFKPIETASFRIVPPWEKSSQQKDNLSEIVIEPGMAFGTGQHESTQLCILALEKLFADGMTVKGPSLDIGTGSGILAIAAGKRGFVHNYGCDIEIDAVQVAKLNGLTNGVELTLWQGSLDKRPNDLPKAQLIFANILLPALKELLPEIAQVLLPGGFVIMSGILVEQSFELEEQAKTLGLSFAFRQSRADWASLVLEKTT